MEMNGTKINPENFKSAAERAKDLFFGFIMFTFFNCVFFGISILLPNSLGSELSLFFTFAFFGMYGVGINYYGKKKRESVIVGIVLAFFCSPFILFFAESLDLVKLTLFEL
jgi:hypothetical protein